MQPRHQLVPMHIGPPRPAMTTRWQLQTVHCGRSARQWKASPLVLFWTSLRDHRGGVYLDDPFRARQRRNDDPSRDRKDTLQPPPNDLIDGFPIANVGEVNDDLDD